jgi:streptogramin lyase
MRKILVFALIAILIAFAVMCVPFAKANSAANSTEIPMSSSVSVTPITEITSPYKIVVNPTTSKVEPIRIAATPENLSSPTFSWATLLIAVVFIVIIIGAFSIKKSKKLHRMRYAGSLAMVSLILLSAGHVYGDETLNVSVWSLGSGIYPIIVRESVDSAGRVWFGAYTKIGYLNPITNEVSIWIVPELQVGDLYAVSVDYADKVWFASTNRIGQFDPSTNFFTVWPILGVNNGRGFPYAIPTVSVDSNGNAFFPICDANKIACINPVTNDLTEWLIPTNNSMPCYTMVDANGYVWFAEQAGNKIGRLNPYTNEITEWSIPTPSAYPTGLYVANGVVFFTQYGARKIGRLDPSANEMTQWSFSNLPGGRPFGTFVDLNNNVWFTDWIYDPYYKDNAYLYRLDTNNVFTYWHFWPAECYRYGVTVDTKVDIGSVYVSGFVDQSEYTSAGNAILRFRH